MHEDPNLSDFMSWRNMYSFSLYASSAVLWQRGTCFLMFYGADLFYSDTSEHKITSLGRLGNSHGVVELTLFLLPNKNDPKRQMQTLGTIALMLRQQVEK